MTKPALTQIWNPQACKPKQDILEGRYLQAELALDLHTIANGTAKPPYNNPVSFFEATHITPTLQTLLQDVLGRLAGTKKTTNPILVFNVGFGGGKTHAMAALYYATKHGTNPQIKKLIGNIPTPQNCQIVVISGDEYGGKGVQRGKHQIKTFWSDLLYQLGQEQLALETDTAQAMPDRQTITKLLTKQPVLILLDEISKYLDLIKNDADLLGKVKHFIHTLTLAVCDSENSTLIVSVASDAYIDAADAVRRELTEAMSILNRKMQSIEPVKSEDVPNILKKRLFDFINTKTAETTAQAYTQLYTNIKAPDRFRRAEYKQRITETYPFHPELIDVLYERLSTLPKFQRTRGALRLLAHVIRKTWQTKEKDTYLIQPHHVDLSVPEIVQELTTRLDEDKYINAIASDVYSHSGRKAKAQQNDEDYRTHFQAPLFRRACNTIYLYSLTGAKEEAKGIDTDTLIAALATPEHEDHVKWYRDQVLPKLENFWYIEPVGNRYVFKKEPTESRVIDQESQNVPTPKVTKVVYNVLQSLFATPGKGHFSISLFPDDPSAISDDMTLKVAVLNPLLGHTIPSEEHVPDKVATFILNRDARGNLRAYRNNTFLLAARDQAWETLRDAAARLEVARALAEDPEKYGIPHDKKKKLQQKVATYEATVNDAVRAVFTFLVYATKGGKIEAKSFRPSGYGTAQTGQDLLWYVLSNILNRVKDESLDPEYAKSEAWPAEATETTTRAFYENIHKKTGIVLPASQSLFEQTIIEGVKRGTWILIQQNKLHAPENPPTRAIISSDSQLLLPEEAARRELTDPRGHLCKNCLSWPCKCGKIEAPQTGPGITVGPTPLEWETFEMAPPNTQLKDLDRWVNREGIDILSEAIIRVKGSTDVATQFRNLIRLARAGRRLTTKVKVSARTIATNLRLDCIFEADDTGLDTPAAKLLDDIGRWALPEFEGQITLKAEKIPINELKELLKTLKTEDPNTKLSLELKPKQVK